MPYSYTDTSPSEVAGGIRRIISGLREKKARRGMRLRGMGFLLADVGQELERVAEVRSRDNRNVRRHGVRKRQLNCSFSCRTCVLTGYYE